MSIQTVRKSSMVTDDSSPVMLAISLSKEFAPFEYGGIKKATVCIDPKLSIDTKIPMLCVFHSKTATNSNPKAPLIPAQTRHPFQLKPATRAG